MEKNTNLIINNLDEIFKILETEVKKYSVPIVDLIAVQTKDPFKVLVATILSSRTKDQTTAKSAARLFKKAPDLKSLNALSVEEIRKLIYPVGFYKVKAAHLKKLPIALDRFGSQIPDDIESLITLPGVGRKTANLVRSVAFGKPAICVDTHVHRITNIWGYVQTKTPLETEMALREKLPQKYWQRINSLLVAFGQEICRPISPQCFRCPIEKFCPKLGVTNKTAKRRKSMKSNDTKRLLSWNVNGIRAIEKKGFIDIIARLDADIVAIQEIKAQPDQLSEALLKIDDYASYWHPAEKKGYAGVCVYSRIKPINIFNGFGVEEFDREGRVLTLEFDNFFLVNVYFPNAQPGLARIDFKISFNNAVLAYADSLAKKKSVVICGDFNVAHKPIDLKNPKENENNPGFSLQERQWMDTFIDAGYIDTFRKFNQDPDQYTWWSYRFNARARNIGWRIDYFCVDQKSDGRVLGAEILQDIMGSDHCPVLLEFR